MRRPPAHAWAWLQRSRPVLAEAAQRLTGHAPTPGFVDELRDGFTDDPFTRDVLIATIADVAFGGRIPDRRPAGASWDRGLIWWAAALAGTTPAEFEGRGRADGQQEPLFEGDHSTDGTRGRDPAARARAVTQLAVRAPERAALAASLRNLLAQSDGDQVPASAVRDLLAELDG